jgi:GNAT superfamily N-acetyltransferase
VIHIRRMTAAHLAAGLGLSRQAGWNQTEADWRRITNLQPDGCFVAESDGAVAGTAAACVFGRVAWVALVLVDTAFRRRGIGRALMEHALDFLDARGVAAVRLDATPLGQPLYEQFGFVEQFRLARFEGTLPDDDTPADRNVLAVPTSRWPELAALDREVTRTDRQEFVLRLFAESPEDVRGVQRDGRWAGLLAARHGARAVQVGPCLGEAGPLLLADAFRRHAGRLVYVDVPLLNEAACRLVAAGGLDVQRHLTRMCRGEQVVEQVDLLWASSGPEKG